jgi:misacylated tRNA(Ala) deacylase
MTRYFCHDHPDVLTLETVVADNRPGAVRLQASPFHPGGGGQLADRGILRWLGGEARVTGFEARDDGYWHILDAPAEVHGHIEALVDPDFRGMQTELHTGTHVLNALVFRQFDGALVTSAQMNDDNTARMDFDLPDADNDRLRALEAEMNEIIRQDLAIRYRYVGIDEARAEPGLIRSRSVAPPPDAEGGIRIVEITGLDAQACGGTHLASTGLSRPFKILKIENKGRHNRRVRIGLIG